MKNILLGVFALLSMQAVAQQPISGQVLDENGKGLPGANIYAYKIDQGTSTDNQGNFDSFLEAFIGQTPLIISFVGYVPDTVESGTDLRIVLKPSTLDEVEVKERQERSTSFISGRDVEELFSGEIRKSACCNLSESFESNPAVNVSFTDALTGTRRIRMLGLDGRYSQILVEGMSFLDAHEPSSGVSFIPGPWISSVQLIKGGGSVVQGSEALTGQINLTMVGPENFQGVQADVFTNIQGRFETSVIATYEGEEYNGRKFNGGTYVHTASQGYEIDNNFDGFLDMPLKNGYGVMQRVGMVKNKFSSTLNFGILSEEFESVENPDDFFRLNQVDPFASKSVKSKGFATLNSGYSFERPGTSLGLILRANNSNLDFSLGDRRGRVELMNTKATLLFSSYLGNTNHKYTLGLDQEYFDYSINRLGFTYGDAYFIGTQAGVFGEYTLDGGPRYSVVAGLRVNNRDMHSEPEVIVLPRLNLRFNPNEHIVLRANIGKSYRNALPFLENIDAFANRREIRVIPNSNIALSKEQGWNYGGSVAYRRTFNNIGVSSKVETYYTKFDQRALVDRETEGEIAINSNGAGEVLNVLWTNNFDFGKQWTYNVSYQRTSNKAVFSNGLQELILVPRWRMLNSIDWRNRLETSSITFIAQTNGPSRLPEHHRIYSDESPVMTFFHVQYTKSYKLFEVYVGMKNVLDTRIQDPILVAENSEDQSFDASIIYAPMIGRTVYGGIRFNIENN